MIPWRSLGHGGVTPPPKALDAEESTRGAPRGPPRAPPKPNSEPREGGVVEIFSRVRSSERRLRINRALRAGSEALCGALLFALVVVSLRKLSVIGERPARDALVCFGIVVLGAIAVAFRWPLVQFAGARALDKFHGFHDRIASALAFCGLPEAERSLFVVATIGDAIVLSRAAHPERAVPVRLPRSLGFAGAIAGVLFLVSLGEVRRHVGLAAPHAIEVLEMAPDDIDEVREFLIRTRRERSSEEVRVAMDEFERLVDDLADHRIDRAETFRRIDILDRSLSSGADGDPKALEGMLERIGEELKKSDLTRQVGEALARSHMDQAADQLRRLAARIRRPDARPDTASVHRMREALREAAAGVARRRQELEDRRNRLGDELLKQRAHGGDGGTDGERSLLDEKKRELERLDREAASETAAQASVDRLDRELQEAAADLAKDLGVGADDLERGAEDINRMAEQQMTNEEKEELRDKLRELRELARQQGGASGKQRLVRLQRFGRMARGESGQAGGSTGPDGSGDEGHGQSPVGPDGRAGSERQGGSGRDSSNGGQRSGSGGETWVLGPNGEKVLMLSRAAASANRSDTGGGPSDGPAAGGRTWGDGHDPNVRGKATELKSGSVDTEVSGSDTGQGPTRSQTILGAAERGFVSQGYKKVFTEYETVAEESLAKEDIPGGYRYYVKRYFQLIRPRDGR